MLHSLFAAKLLAALVLLLIAALAGYYPYRRKQLSCANHAELPSAEAFAAGVFLGAGLLHMLSTATTQFAALGYHYPWASLIAGLLFLILLGFEHAHHAYYAHKHNSGKLFALLAMTLLSIHSLLEGTALGLSANVLLAGMIFFAIFAHKWAAGFALAIQMNKSSLTTWVSLALFAIFALMTPIGVLLGDWIHNHSPSNSLLTPIFTALAAGTFLYLGTLHGLKQSILVHTGCRRKHLLWVLAGFVIMAVVAIWT